MLGSKRNPMNAVAAMATAFLSLFLVAGSAQAISFSTNVRDVLLTEGSTSSEPSLESVLLDEGTYSGGYGQADQSVNALFSPVGSEAVAGLVIEHAGYRNHNQLGIYNLDGVEVSIFAGAASAGDTALLLFQGDDLVVGGQTYEDFGTSFGLFLRNENVGFTWYSQDALNDGGRAHFLAFEDASSDTVYFGFEDLDLGDRDYNDFVGKISGVTGALPPSTPVPEPSSALLMGVGMLALASRRRSLRRS